jgi:hypothetical protein
MYEICYTLTQALQEQGRLSLSQEGIFEMAWNNGDVGQTKLGLPSGAKSGWSLKVILWIVVPFLSRCDGATTRKTRRRREETIGICNCHFTGESYGLEACELQRRRDYRSSQYALLLHDVQSLIKQYSGKVDIIIAGDFDSIVINSTSAPKHVRRLSSFCRVITMAMVTIF